MFKGSIDGHSCLNVSLEYIFKKLFNVSWGNWQSTIKFLHKSPREDFIKHTFQKRYG